MKADDVDHHLDDENTLEGVEKEVHRLTNLRGGAGALSGEQYRAETQVQPHMEGYSALGWYAGINSICKTTTVGWAGTPCHAQSQLTKARGILKRTNDGLSDDKKRVFRATWNEFYKNLPPAGVSLDEVLKLQQEAWNKGEPGIAVENWDRNKLDEEMKKR